MHIVAIYNLGNNENDLAKSLAEAIGKTIYETRSRLRVTGRGPSVVAVFSDIKHAEECAAKLVDSSFDVIVLPQDAIESDNNRFLVRSFELSDQGLRAEARDGQSVMIPYRNIDLMLCGSSIMQHGETETVRDRKFSMGRAMLSGGMMVSKTTKKTMKSTVQDRERFLYVYTGNHPTIVFRENSVLYNSLGQSLQSSRSANFSFVIAELRRLGPGTIYDDRLLNMAAQVQMLGPSLRPEEHLDVATSLLARVFR
jgi:hypothetical protein